jgi:hypothetical protein
MRSAATPARDGPYPLYTAELGRPALPTDRSIEPRLPDDLRHRVEHRLREQLLGVVDRGLLGLTHALKVHLVLCGFPRAGTSMLQLMAQTSFDGCRVWERETVGHVLARIGLRNHPYMITKRPNDIFWIDNILEYYAGKRAEARVVMNLRDPRSVLTSRFKGLPGYYVPPKTWYAYYQHFVYHREDPRVLVVRYADLVRRPDAVQAELVGFTGMEPIPGRKFSEFHVHASADYDTRALNGVRAPDPKNVDRWRGAEHRARIQALLVEIPELPQMLVQLGLEADDAWVGEYA